MCVVGEGDPCEVWRESWVVARKEHRCVVCRSLIRAGERYLQHFNVFEGEASSQKACGHCMLTRHWFDAAHEVTFPPSALRELLRDCIAEGDEESDATWGPALGLIEARRAA